MTGKPIGVLLAGFAGIGDQDHQSDMYLPALRGHAGFAVAGTAASCAADEATARRVAAELGVPCHDNLSDALADAAVDAVSLAVPPAQRRDAVGAAIRAGKHVLADKPLAESADDVEAIAQELAKSTVVLVPALHHRLHGSIVAARAAIAAGRAGLPWNVQADFVVAGGSLAPGGELHNLGCYPVDVVHALLGVPPRRVHAYTHGPAGADGTVLLIDYERDITATILVARIGPVPGIRSGGLVRHRYRVSGSHGVLDVDATRPALRIRTARTDATRWTGSGTVVALVAGWHRSITGGAAPVPGIDDARHVHAVLDAAARSLRSGRPQAL